MKKFNLKKLNIICTAVSIILMVCVWIIAYYSVGNDYLVPSFSDTVKSFFEMFSENSFWVGLLNTLWRTLASFLFSFLLAALCAILSAISKTISFLLRPLAIFLRVLPTLAVVLLILVWTNPTIAPMIVTFLVLFPMMYAQMLAAISDVDEDLIKMLKVYKVGKKNRIFKVYLPLVSPNIISQSGANISLAIKVMISAEVLASTYRSLGGLMQNARLYLEMPRLAALTLAAVVLGVVFEVLFVLIKKLVCKWDGEPND